MKHLFLIASACLIILGACGTSVDRTLSSSGSSTNPPPPTAQVATPIISPESGFYQDPILATVTVETAGALIYCTQDDSNPTPGSPQYIEPISINQSTTLRCRGFRSGFTPSGVATAVYLIDGTIDPTEFEIAPMEIRLYVDGADRIRIQDGVMNLIHENSNAAEYPNVVIWQPDGSPHIIDPWVLDPYHAEEGIECRWGSDVSSTCVSAPLDLPLEDLEFGKPNFIPASSLRTFWGRNSARLNAEGEIVIDDPQAGKGYYGIAFDYWYTKASD